MKNILILCLVVLPCLITACQVMHLSQTQKDWVVQRHNELRQKIASGHQSGFPSASNMNALVWDNSLEKTALAGAATCKFAHTSYAFNKKGTSFRSVGQNLAYWGSSQKTDETKGFSHDFVADWYSEVKDATPSQIDRFSSVPGKVIGHFTQLVWAETKAVGCGAYQEYSGGFYKTTVYCNYGEAGNMMGSSVYKRGKQCSNCAKCDTGFNGLCANGNSSKSSTSTTSKKPTGTSRNTNSKKSGPKRQRLVRLCNLCSKKFGANSYTCSHFYCKRLQVSDSTWQQMTRACWANRRVSRRKCRLMSRLM